MASVCEDNMECIAKCGVLSLGMATTYFMAVTFTVIKFAIYKECVDCVIAK